MCIYPFKLLNFYLFTFPQVSCIPPCHALPSSSPRLTPPPPSASSLHAPIPCPPDLCQLSIDSHTPLLPGRLSTSPLHHKRQPYLCTALHHQPAISSCISVYLFSILYKFLSMNSYQHLFKILDEYVEQHKTPLHNVREQLPFEHHAASQNLPCYEMNSFESLIDDHLSNTSSTTHYEPTTSIHNTPFSMASYTPPAIECISLLTMQTNTTNTILYNTARSIPYTLLHAISYHSSPILSTTPSTVSQIPKRKKMPVLKKKITLHQFKRYQIRFTENHLIRLFKRFSLNTALHTSD